MDRFYSPFLSSNKRKESVCLEPVWTTSCGVEECDNHCYLPAKSESSYHKYIVYMCIPGMWRGVRRGLFKVSRLVWSCENGCITAPIRSFRKLFVHDAYRCEPIWITTENHCNAGNDRSLPWGSVNVCRHQDERKGGRASKMARGWMFFVFSVRSLETHLLPTYGRCSLTN